MVGILVSFWDDLFSGGMFVSGSVKISKSPRVFGNAKDDSAAKAAEFPIGLESR